MSNVYKMQDWMPEDVVVQQTEDNKGVVMLLTYLLEEAKAGKLEGFTGAFLLAPNDADDEPSVGMVASHRMEELKYLTVGALEQIKVGLLAK